MSEHEILVAKGRDEHARLGAELIGRAITAAVEARGVARVALSGGSTPSAAISAWKSAVVRAVIDSIGSPVSFERALILSSPSVMLRT